jgi:hypothetical protein
MIGLVAHAGGTGWDEVAVFAVPVVILVILQVVGRRKARDAAPGEQDGGGDGEAGGEGGSGDGT